MGSSTYTNDGDFGHCIDKDQDFPPTSLTQQWAALKEQRAALIEALEKDQQEKRQWREEHPREAARDDGSLRVYREDESKWAKEQHGCARTFRQTPIVTCSAEEQQVSILCLVGVNTPCLSVHDFWSTYLIAFRRRVSARRNIALASNSASQPITFRDYGSPIKKFAVRQGVYPLYRANHNARPADIAAAQRFIDYDRDDDPVPVCPENELITIEVGQSIARRVDLKPSKFDPEAGGRYKLLLSHGYLGRWHYGPMNVCVQTSKPTPSRCAADQSPCKSSPRRQGLPYRDPARRRSRYAVI